MDLKPRNPASFAYLRGVLHDHARIATDQLKQLQHQNLSKKLISIRSRNHSAVSSAGCGGLDWRGPVDCVDDSTCVVVNDYYSHCFPNPASTGAPTTAPTRASTSSVAPSLAQDPVDCDDDDDTIGFHNEDGLLTNLTIDEINALYTATYLEARGPALGPYAQCGGLKWAGQTVCVQGFYCRAQSEYFSQCVPIPDLPGIPTYGQCGGQYWTGPTECQVGTTCKVESKWYSQCLPTAY
ncbi:hypothetical protein DYB32_007431 [Aphanomyces invadans]|uniref:CBM1 domain-containing protein n=1 Tax=Aphanomyces invadans TaxID=157072 RepID=A0A3R7CWS9_9STRA|nr:hypothetical protein DYB32_007431 [Aphanomyces invadans]